MPIGSRRLVPRATGVSMLSVENSWASQVLASATTNIKDMARFQQRQLAEKEQKLLQLYDQQQLRAHQVAQRGSAGSNGSNGSGHGNTSHHQTVTRTSTTTHATSNSQGGGGKVRQMFDERRQTTVKGIDKSYPLEPLENRSRKHQTTTTTSNVTVNSTSQLKNGNPTSNRRSVVTRRTVRSEANSNVNDGKPVVTYHEEVSREISDLNDRDNEQEEFGDDNFHVSRYENGNRRVDRPNQLEIEDVTNENTSQRHRTTAKIHLAEFERSNVTNLENEPFPNDEIINMPEKLPGRSSTGRKSFQSETKLERPKISNVKKTGQPIKQVAGNTTSFTKKRNDNSALSGSSTRVAKSQSPDIGTKRSVDTRTKTTTNNLVRRSVPSSPARIADTSNRCGSSELRVSEAKSSMRTLSSPGSRETKNLREYSITTEYTDVTDGTRNGCETTETEIMQTATTRKNSDAFVSDFNDPECLENKKSASSREEFSVGKRPSERSLTSQRQYGSATISTSSRPASALSTTSSATSTRGQSPQINSKSKMSTKAKSPSSDGARGPNSNPRTAPPATDANDGLVSCKICSRRFNSDRVARHEQICSKTTTKKRKQFDATSHRVKGTELEQFVKKGASRKSQADRKAQKPEVKSNWRRKHDDFINAIRSAKQVSAHLAAGGKLSDLPPPPPSDTSDYVQCPHCGRKFNQGAADRHIPKCQTMMHNKPNSRAPPKPKR